MLIKAIQSPGLQGGGGGGGVILFNWSECWNNKVMLIPGCSLQLETDRESVLNNIRQGIDISRQLQTVALCPAPAPA